LKFSPSQVNFSGMGLPLEKTGDVSCIRILLY
jgi:hypothetical protein